MLMMRSRVFKYVAVLAVALTGLAAPAASAATKPAASKPAQDQTWIGQVQRHGNHFDYVGQPCPVGAGMLCANYIAHYRIVPLNAAAGRALQGVNGRQARLEGLLTPNRKPGPHNGTLKVHKVQAWPPPPPPASGVEGHITAGPTCPVVNPAHPCPDRPVETKVRLLRADGSIAAKGQSAKDGAFRIAAAAGHYDLVADNSGVTPLCGPVAVDVRDGRFTHADLMCDTGIR
jgi:hypothetical protein